LNAILRALRGVESEGVGRPHADVEAVARMLERPVAEIRQLLKLGERTTSLDAPLDNDAELSMVDAIADTQSADPEAQFEQAEIEHHVADWIGQLSDRQRLIIERRYGLKGFEICSLNSLADELGVSRERVRQIQCEALAQLRQCMSTSGVSRDGVF
jgi:RNA polymerase nonessential primary-like sigma factor